jgi:radical SAM superfamily enzyme YgiQ (UPF0313 family)
MAYDEKIIQKMKKAGFTLVFLGMENVSSKNLDYYSKGNIVNHTKRAVTYLRENGICVLGGLVLGAEDDTEEDIAANFQFLTESKVDGILAQILTPYPGTELRDELMEKGLITNKDGWERYHGHFANIRTKTLSPEQLDYYMWKYMQYFYDWRNKNILHLNITKTYPYFIFRTAFIETVRGVAKLLRSIGKDKYESFRIEFQDLVNVNEDLV